MSSEITPNCENMNIKNPIPFLLEKGHHRDHDVLFFHFAYSAVMHDAVKSIPGIRYSNTRKSWYIPYSNICLERLPKDISYKLGSTLDGSQNNQMVPDSLQSTQLPEIELSQFYTNLKVSHAPLQHKVNIDQYWLEKINDYEEWMMAKRYAPSTIKAYVSILKIYFVWAKGKNHDKSICQANIEHFNYDYFIQEKYSISYQNIWINALKQFLERYSEYQLDVDKIERPRRQKRLPTILSEPEIKRLIRSYTNLKHKTMMMTLYACGLRKSELINLKIRDIDGDRKVIRIRQSKGAKDRDVALPGALHGLLRRYYEKYEPKEYLFNGAARSRKISASSIRKILMKGLKKAEINKYITPHSLRHSYATHLVERNVNLRYIQEALGHKSSRTTEIYTKLNKEDIKNMVSPIDFWV